MPSKIVNAIEAAKWMEAKEGNKARNIYSNCTVHLDGYRFVYSGKGLAFVFNIEDMKAQWELLPKEYTDEEKEAVQDFAIELTLGYDDNDVQSSFYAFFRKKVEEWRNK